MGRFTHSALHSAAAVAAAVAARHAAPGVGVMAWTARMSLLATVSAMALALPDFAVAQAPPPGYGAPVSLELARDAIAKARAEAQRNNWQMAIAVVDPSGNLVALERMDQTQTFSIQIAVDKARTAGGLKRSTKVLEDAVGAGRTAILSLAGVTAVEGGLPIIVNGQVVGAIGVSGATSAQYGQVAAAGLAER